MLRRLLVLLLLLPSLPAMAATWTGNAHVVDGDTLKMDGTRLRLLAMDAFETRQTCERGGTTYGCGVEATNTMVSMTQDQQVSCSGRKHDRYRRPLVHCHAGGRDLGREMVRQGWAVAEYGRQYRRDEQDARLARAGAWAGTFERPKLWRQRQKHRH